jgi:fatty-acyl-CoA synthase
VRLPLIAPLARLPKQAATKLHTLRAFAGAGVVRPTRPDHAVRMAHALLSFGPTPAGGYTAASVRYPSATALVDERGTLTFGDVQRRTNALADALSVRGLRAGDRVAIMCRNHRGWIETVIACSKLGCHALFLNTAFSGPQLAEVCAREDPQAVVFDDEFAAALEAASRGRRRFVAWQDDPGAEPADATLDALIATGDPADRSAPPVQGKAIVLTSGTTGTPKGANRSQPRSLDPAGALLSVIPLRARESTMIAAPLFHAWGFTHFTLAMALSSTLVLRRRFDPAATLELTARHGCSALVVVPVMLQRILELPDEVLARYDLSRVRAVPVSGSALPAAVSARWMDRFGENLFNLYGSTEVAWATIATPQDLREAPQTAGRPPFGTVVKLFDDRDRPVREPDTVGRVFVGNEMQFEGYTGGGAKEVLDGLMSSGDVGHFDAQGRLFIDGRDDDMIVSGGENVFPGEVEDLLHGHEAIAEAAVLGVEDPDWGARLRAVVVLRPGARLDERAVKDFVRARLAAYKVPRDVVFCDALPRTSTGKLLKREL